MSSFARRARQGLVNYLPPVYNVRFWSTQLLVLVVAVVHAVAHFVIGGYADVFVAVAFVLPVLYAALEFGTRGSIATTALVVILLLPFIIDDALTNPSGPDLAGHAAELAVFIVFAPTVGRAVEREKEAHRAREASEVHYRALFENSGVPALVLDERGCIREANPAASSLLRASLEGQYLSDIVGRAAADAILGGAPPPRIDVFSDLALRPVVSKVVNDQGGLLSQVIFQDVTEEAAGSKRTRAFALAVLVAQEDERKRISQELHDEALQVVLELRRRIERVLKGITGDDPGKRELVSARYLADELIDDLRTVAVRLRPPVIDVGLSASLEQLVAEVKRRGIPVQLQIEGSESEPPPDIALCLYRVAQEALTNVERHSGARNVTVHLNYSSAATAVVVEDDGVGFKPADKERPNPAAHLGLLGMRERLEMVGGTLGIASAAGAGTTITATVPKRG